MRITCPYCQNPIESTDGHADELLCAACGSSFRMQDTSLSTTTTELRTLDKFQLLDRVGVGAFGTVWRARDTELDRIVALKIMHPSLLVGDGDRQRFDREARAAAHLRHPGIVTVYEVAELEGLPTIVSEFVDGVTLRELLEVRRLTFREAAELVAQIAEALDYAHAMGLVHRDIKPANIMIEFPRGEGLGSRIENQNVLGSKSSASSSARESARHSTSSRSQASFVGPRALLLDFGLALRDEVEITLTADGQIIGTPAYMSPEQAAGESHGVDRRSDVYGLGAVLYETLTGEVPFRGSKVMMLQQLLHEEPRLPRRINDKIPRDLETICLKAMAKERGRRYATARQLADDLRSYLRDEPIRARPVGPAERLWRWCHRNPLVAGLTATAATLLILVALAASIGYAKTAHALNREAQQRAEAERQRDAAHMAQQQAQAAREVSRALLYAADMNLVPQALEAGNVGRARELLQRHVPKSTVDADLRGFEWRYLWRLCQGESLCTFPMQGVHCLTFSSDGTLLATGGNGAVKLWDVPTQQEIATFNIGEHSIYSLAFAPDGTTLAEGDDSGSIYLWEVSSQRRLRSLEGHKGIVHALAFSPDGTLIATGSTETREVKLWQVASGEELDALEGHSAGVTSLAFSCDSATLASCGVDATIKLWDVATKQERVTLKGYTQLVKSVAFRPDGDLLASGGSDGVVKLWSTTSGVEVAALKGYAGEFVAFSPDGKTLATGGGDTTVKLWDVATMEEVTTLTGHTDGILCVAFSPDGKALATAAYDNMVKLWSAAARPDQDILKGHTAWVTSVAFSPDGKTLATAGEDRTVKLWNAATQELVGTLEGHADVIRCVAFSPDNSLLASGGGNWLHRDNAAEVKLWDVAARREAFPPLKGQKGCISAVAFSPDGGTLFSASNDFSVTLWNVVTREEKVTFHLPGPTYRTGLALSPNSSTLAIANGAVTFWDLATKEKQPVGNMPCSGTIYLAFSPDGRMLATNYGDRTVMVWDLAAQREYATFKGHNGTVISVAFSPDGKTLATGAMDNTVKLWSIPTKQEVLTLKAHKQAVASIAFSPDGNTLATASGDRTVRLWRAAPFENSSSD